MAFRYAPGFDRSSNGAMTRKKHAARVALAAAADQLVAEVWENKWNHVPEVKSTPIGLWVAIPRELERRCPGHSLEEYRDAISRCMFTRR
jgi:hypothetical protein